MSDPRKALEDALEKIRHGPSCESWANGDCDCALYAIRQAYAQLEALCAEQESAADVYRIAFMEAKAERDARPTWEDVEDLLDRECHIARDHLVANGTSFQLADFTLGKLRDAILAEHDREKNDE